MRATISRLCAAAMIRLIAGAAWRLLFCHIFHFTVIAMSLLLPSPPLTPDYATVTLRLRYDDTPMSAFEVALL